MGTISIDIRQAEPADAQQIADVHDTSWRNAYAGILPHSALTKMIQRRGTNWWARAINRATAIQVLDIGDNLAGYVTLGPNRVTTLPFEGEIYELYLKPEYQGLGFGSRLFLSARNELKRRGISGCVVWVLEDNDPAIRFYENAGGKLIAQGSECFDGKTVAKIAYAWS